MDKNVHLTRHARTRMKERGISREQVKAAILKAQIRMKTVDNKERVRFELLGRTLEVIYVDEPERYVVVTAVWATR